jgi:hypothetical protein
MMKGQHSHWSKGGSFRFHQGYVMKMTTNIGINVGAMPQRDQRDKPTAAESNDWNTNHHI